MNLLNSSYFFGPLALAQLGKQSVNDNLNDFISRFEPEVLQAALGYELASDFISGLIPGSDEAIDQKWLDLRDGIAFNNGAGIRRKWKGFANDTSKQSAIAPVIYVALLADSATAITGIGAVVSEGENAITSNPTVKMSSAWFTMYRDIQILWEFLRVNRTTYMQFSYSQIDYCYFAPINQFGI